MGGQQDTELCLWFVKQAEVDTIFFLIIRMTVLDNTGDFPKYVFLLRVSVYPQLYSASQGYSDIANTCKSH